MAKLKTTQVKVSALATNPDKYALPAGSCAEAKNVVSRRPGVIEPLTEDKLLLTVDTLSTYKPIKAFNDKLYGGRFAVVQAQAAQAPVWVSTDAETQTGIINTFVFDNKNSTPTYSTNTTHLEVAWDYGTDGFLHAVNRDPGFIPGMTHDAYNTFRTLVTEKWGVIVNFERYAGLYPPMLKLALTQVAAPVGQTLDQNNWLVPNNTVSYRAVLTIDVEQSADDPSGLFSPSPKAYIVKGPPSQVFSVKQETYGDNASVIITPTLSNLDGLPGLANGSCNYFFEVYRCPQDEVRDPTYLTDDYRLVAKLAIPKPTASTFPSMGISAFPWLDDITEDGRNGGEALYTNSGQQGEQGANYCPPSSADVCTFKDTVFYANRASFPAKAYEMRGAFGDLLTDREVKYGIGHRVIAGTINVGNAIISIGAAADMVGLAVGQVITCNPTPPTAPPWTAGTFVRITAINTGAQTITVSVIPSGPGLTLDMVVADCIDILVYSAAGTVTAIKHLDPTDPVGSAIAWNPGGLPLSQWPAGLRFKTLFGHVIDSYPPQEGYKFEIVHTTPAHLRVTRILMQMTNPQNYAPQGLPIGGSDWVEGTYEQRRNIVYLSKTSEPEHVPLGNFQVVGAGTILKMWPTTSAIFFFCTDGLWRLTGDGTTWTVDQIDPTCFLVHPDLVTSLNNKIYAMTNDGLSIITDTGAQSISDDAIGSILLDQLSEMRSIQTGSGVRQQTPYVFGPTMAADHHFNEVWWSLTKAGFGTISLIDAYIFNEDTKSFTRQTIDYRGITYYERNRRLAYVKGTATWTINVKHDFFSSADPESSFPLYMPVTIEFNPLVSEDMGDLKQWMDMSFFMTLHGTIFTLWNEESRFVYYPQDNYMKLFPATHFWVPREFVSKPTLEKLGFTTAFTDTYFELFGFTVRYRVASDTLKRA